MSQRSHTAEQQQAASYFWDTSPNHLLCYCQGMAHDKLFIARMTSQFYVAPSDKFSQTTRHVSTHVFTQLTVGHDYKRFAQSMMKWGDLKSIVKTINRSLSSLVFSNTYISDWHVSLNLLRYFFLSLVTNRNCVKWIDASHPGPKQGQCCNRYINIQVTSVEECYWCPMSI